MVPGGSGGGRGREGEGVPVPQMVTTQIPMAGRHGLGCVGGGRGRVH